MQKAEWAEHDVFGVHLAIEEALVNAIKHGNRKDPTKTVEIVCHISRNRSRFALRMKATALIQRPFRTQPMRKTWKSRPGAG